jgi:hypothetical protein
MASSENQQQTFPAVPPSLSAGDHEMRDYYAPQNVPRPSIHQAPYLTPYLGLRARLSQVWLNRWTVLLLLVLARTLIAVAGNKAAPYTIQPRPFPTFEPTSNAYSSEAEKVGQVGAHNVGDSVARPGHLRASSHGDLGGNSPFNEKSANNPFSD